MNRSGGPIIGLQHLRGLAALGVVIYHAGAMTALPKYYGKEVIGGALVSGAFGVDIFFLISGFIIATSSLDREWMPRLNATSFAWRRFSRIVPLMWLSIISYFILRAVGRGATGDIHGYISAMFLLPVGPVEPKTIWTLRHEMIFYAVFCVAVLIGSRKWWIIAAWAFSPLLAHPILGPLDLAAPAPQQVIAIIANPVNLEFGAGLTMGLFWLRFPQPVVSTPINPLYILAALFIISCGASWFLHFRRSLSDAAISSLICAAILWVGIVVRCPAGMLTSAGVLLGDASFSLYLFHPHVVSASLGMLAKATPHISPWLAIAMSSSAAVCAGIVCHLLIERPIISWCRTLGTRFAPSLAAN